MRHASQSGFTLVEIMVVVFILGLLAAMVVPNLIGQSDQASVETARIEIATIKNSLQLFKLRNRFYPSTAEGLDALLPGNCPPRARVCPPEGFLDKDPVDPWGNPYAYFNEGGRIRIVSYGEDGVPGGDGYAADLSSDDP